MLFCFSAGCAAYKIDVPDYFGDRSTRTPKKKKTLRRRMEPFAIHSLSPVQLLRSSIEPASPYCMPHGKSIVRSSASWVNYWGYYRDEYLFDVEIVDVNANMRWAFAPCWEVKFGIQEIYAGGGLLDRFIEGFHSALGFSDFNRPDYPRNNIRIYVENDQGEIFDYERHRPSMNRYSESFFCGIKKKLLPEREDAPAVSATVFFKQGHKVRDDLPGYDNTFDWGWALIAGKEIGDFVFYLNFGEVYFDETSFGGIIELTKSQRNLFSCLEWKMNSSSSLFLQSLYVTRAAVDFPELSEYTLEAYLGFKHHLDAETILELAVIENLLEYFNSPDVGFYLGVSTRF